METIVELPGTQERQRVTVRCPEGGRLASVVALCLVMPGKPGSVRERRILLEIVRCSLGSPGRGCISACEPEVRRVVES
jgi:hypothetical protein